MEVNGCHFQHFLRYCKEAGLNYVEQIRKRKHTFIFVTTIFSFPWHLYIKSNANKSRLKYYFKNSKIAEIRVLPWVLFKRV